MNENKRIEVVSCAVAHIVRTEAGWDIWEQVYDGLQRELWHKISNINSYWLIEETK